MAGGCGRIVVWVSALAPARSWINPGSVRRAAEKREPGARPSRTTPAVSGRSAVAAASGDRERRVGQLLPFFPGVVTTLLSDP